MKKLFNNNQNREPSFQKQTAEKYFKETLNDNKRDYKYHPMQNMKRPPAPHKKFNSKPPTLKELNSYLNSKKELPGYRTLSTRSALKLHKSSMM